MWIGSEDGTEGATEAFGRLGAKLSSLKGRHFYGLLQNGEYRAAVARSEDDDPLTLELESGVIPGGDYLRTRLVDWERVEQIGEAFKAMAAGIVPDASRPEVEFYRRERELLLFLPIKG